MVLFFCRTAISRVSPRTPFRRMISSMTWQVWVSFPPSINLAQELHSFCNYCPLSRTPGNGRLVTLLGAEKKLQAGHPALRFTSLLAQIVQLDPMSWWCHLEVVRLVNVFVVSLHNLSSHHSRFYSNSGHNAHAFDACLNARDSLRKWQLLGLLFTVSITDCHPIPRPWWFRCSHWAPDHQRFHGFWQWHVHRP